MTALKVLARVSSKALKNKRGPLKRKKVSIQLNNIRRSCRLAPDAWSPIAEARLQSWLLGEQPTHRPRASTEKAVRKTIAKVKPGVGFRDRCRDLDKYLRFNKVGTLEGHMGVDRGKGELLRMVVKSKQPVCVAQTGLCSGHSASCILDACKQATLISFEIKQNDLSKCACSYISEKFPGRHSVVYGNSQETLPKFIADRLPLERYNDLAFIDGVFRTGARRATSCIFASVRGRAASS